MAWELILLPFYQGGDCDSERLSGKPKATQLINIWWSLDLNPGHLTLEALLFITVVPKKKSFYTYIIIYNN